MASSQPTSVAAPQPQQPSLFANMASTAAGVAVGSTIGHTLGHGISSLFGGSSSSQPVQQQPVAANNAMPEQNFNACETDQRAFMRCLDSHSNDITACQFYLDMLKQCQQTQSEKSF
jgi:hypothetical protein